MTHHPKVYIASTLFEDLDTTVLSDAARYSGPSLVLASHKYGFVDCGRVGRAWGEKRSFFYYYFFFVDLFYTALHGLCTGTTPSKEVCSWMT